LKLFLNKVFNISGLVEKQHPLKQGLKPRPFSSLTPPLWVEKQHPLKQGLKQSKSYGRGYAGNKLRNNIH